MKVLGKVLHLSNSRKLILRMRSASKVSIGTDVLSDGGIIIGAVSDIFGPIDNPYVSVKPSIKNSSQYVSHTLYFKD